MPDFAQWDNVLGAASRFIEGHWVHALISALVFLVGIWWGKWRAWRRWTQRNFLHRLNISLNTIDQGRLKIRTLVEKDMIEILLNEAAVGQLQAAAKKAVPENPIVKFPKADDYWYFLNAVLNEVSEKFALGYIKKDLQQPTASAIYLVCLTFEVDGSVRTRKVRAMVIRKDLLLNLPNEITLENPWHSTRVDTLRKMATRWQSNPEQFLEMEIGV